MGLAALAAACSNPAANCTSATDCDADEVCVEGGGLLVGGGRCLDRQYLTDGGPTDVSDTTTDDGSETDVADVDTSPGDADPPDAAETGEVCAPSTTRPCYEGPPGTAGVGICQKGTRSCTDGGDQTCTGQTLPNSYDRCNNGRDDDCDGAIDELARAGNPCIAGCNCRSNRCIDGECAHRVFVTSEVVTGDLGGVSGADTFCQRMADAGARDGSWKAILSSTTADAKSRLRIAAPIVGLDGRTIADGADDLWDETLAQPIQVDEDDTIRDYSVWSGTRPDGSPEGRDCQNWSSNEKDDKGVIGESSKTGQRWIQADVHTCAKGLALYCIDGQ